MKESGRFFIGSWNSSFPHAKLQGLARSIPSRGWKEDKYDLNMQVNPMYSSRPRPKACITESRHNLPAEELYLTNNETTLQVVWATPRPAKWIEIIATIPAKCAIFVWDIKSFCTLNSHSQRIHSQQKGKAHHPSPKWMLQGSPTKWNRMDCKAERARTLRST